MDNSDEKIEKYRKLVKEYGSKKASKIMREAGGLYDEDFTKEHKNDPIFSDDKTEELAEKTPVTIVKKAIKIETEVPILTSSGEWLIADPEPEPTENVQTPEEEEVYS